MHKSEGIGLESAHASAALEQVFVQKREGKRPFAESICLISRGPVRGGSISRRLQEKKRHSRLLMGLVTLENVFVVKMLNAGRRNKVLVKKGLAPQQRGGLFTAFASLLLVQVR